MRKPAVYAVLWLTLIVAASVLAGCNGEPPPPPRPNHPPLPIPTRRVVQPGDVLWHFRHWGRGAVSSPTVVEGVAYVGSWDRHVCALDTATGEMLWRFKTSGKVYFPPTVVDGVAYFGSLTTTCTRWRPPPVYYVGASRPTMTFILPQRWLTAWPTSVHSTITCTRWTPQLVK